MAVPAVRGGRLVKVGQEDGPCHRLHHLQLEPQRGRHEAVRGAGAEEHRAGGGGQVSIKKGIEFDIEERQLDL